MFLPEEDRYSLSKQSILSQICSLYGGRIAEEMTLGTEGVTTGASNDIERATKMAHNMVTKWGLSERLGPLQYNDEHEEVFLGRSTPGGKILSSDTTKMIDEEIRSIIESCYARASKLLEDNRDKLEAMKDALLEYETIDALQINDIMEGRKPRPPSSWDDNNFQTGSPVSGDGGQDKNSQAEGKPIGGPAGEH
jgi:cell division protease FtsH